MKQNVCINAYKALDVLTHANFDGTTAFKIFKLRKALKEIYDFQAEEEKRIFADYGASFNEDGSIVLEDMEKAEEFVAKITEMSEIEHDEIIPVSIPARCFDNISVEEMEKLDGVIEFTE